MTQVVLLAGITNSSPEHWQTYWQQLNPDYHKVEQDNWDYPFCSEWVTRLDEAVAEKGQDTILVAHSLACLLVAHWAKQTTHPIRGALLVAVPDPKGVNFPVEAKGFDNPPTEPFKFPSMIIASTDDPYSTLDFSKQCAKQWGSEWHNIGAKGHINSASNLGAWQEGQVFLEKLMDSTQ